MLLLEVEEGTGGEAAGLAAVLTLAVLQGLAEFLPISSSGHLAIGRALLGVREAGLALDVALHVGTLAAVLWAYRVELRGMVRDCFQGRTRMLGWLVVATLPAVVAGFAGRDVVREAASSVGSAGAGLLATAGILMLGERVRGRRARRAPLEGGAEREETEPTPATYGHPTWTTAIVLGLVQVLALWPGISRSGTTIVAGLCLGLGAVQAARLSFLMSIPVIAGAAVLEVPEVLTQGTGGLEPGTVLLGGALAAVVGWMALRGLLLVLRAGTLWGFAGYCAVMGGVALTVL